MTAHRRALAIAAALLLVVGLASLAACGQEDAEVEETPAVVTEEPATTEPMTTDMTAMTTDMTPMTTDMTAMTTEGESQGESCSECAQRLCAQECQGEVLLLCVGGSEACQTCIQSKCVPGP